MRFTKTKILLAIIAFGLSFYALFTKHYEVTPYAFLLICAVYLMVAIFSFIGKETKRAYMYLALGALFGTYTGIIY